MGQVDSRGGGGGGGGGERGLRSSERSRKSGGEEDGERERGDKGRSAKDGESKGAIGDDVSLNALRGNPTATILCGLTLLLICVMAFSIRLFSYLSKAGVYNFWNWFDDRTWYPLGRVVGGTVYPGLMLTAGTMWKIANSLNIPLSVETVCVFTAPVFSANTAWATFLLAKEVRGPGAGLTAAALIATVPSYISRSVAGSYDNEGIAIFALVFTFFLYLKTLNTGSLFYATANALAYFYMVCSWGGYTFIINLIPIHALVCLFSGRYSSRLYVAFAPLVVFGTLLAASVPVVGFNAVMTSEHFASFLVFCILHIVALVCFLKRILPKKTLLLAQTVVITLGLGGAIALGAVLVAMVAKSPTLGWSGRSLSLLDPTYASKYIPIIASVSEHQPPTWPSYFMDIHILAFLVPAGFVACFLPLSDASLFLVLYGVTSVYFSGVMVRLMLVLAPAACILSGVALSAAFNTLTRSAKFHIYGFIFPKGAPVESEAKSTAPTEPKVTAEDSATDSASEVVTPKVATSGRKRRGSKMKEAEEEPQRERKSAPSKGKSTSKPKVQDKRTAWPLPLDVSLLGLALLLSASCFYMYHSVWAASEAYSAPSIVLSTHTQDGRTHIFDDFREAYAWLRHNTREDAKVVSWWDYGYQTTAMANRTVLVDNNTWNNTHIATVGTAMSSPERQGWEIFKALDVDYVFVIFGGMVGYPSDDINKFLWMVRIGGGVFPHIKESDYLRNGQYRIDAQATPTMLNCLMYKLSYYRFTDATGDGYDRVRGTQIGKKHFKLNYFEEVFTTQHWMVRIYKLKPVKNRTRGRVKARTKQAVRTSLRGSVRKIWRRRRT
ncbi:hypothetical protein CBR_g8744 [Chara braunii]|uniref:dolichyl-diphosphooligosaccharide--protein glycotransferase n=1 Tax=Chara braunii TaxID=69332 RepID=A0A388KMP0_CHABU|nr:hypothetical protein CBR_g8744 [Chara braunii]|eukprot:GBG71322.1 hypothetical protein CBR_g8744 [Chara braunii]